MTSLDALVAWVGRELPEWSGGLDDAEAEALEAALGQPLPATYRACLARVGRLLTNMGTGHTSFALARVHEVIEIRRDEGFARFVPIGGSTDDGPYFVDMYLDLTHPAGDGDARVVTITIDGSRLETPRPRYPALTDLLWSHVFHITRMRPMEEQTALRWPGLDSAEVDRVLCDLGFANLGVTHPDAGLYERADAAAYLYREPDDDLNLHVTAVTPAIRASVVEQVIAALPPRGRRDQRLFTTEGMW